jgi:hypothetical protein
MRVDGTFSTFQGNRKIYEGRWYLTTDGIGSQGVELDRTPGSGIDGSADEFELVRRYGQICWKTASADKEYFCKAKIPNSLMSELEGV